MGDWVGCEDVGGTRVIYDVALTITAPSTWNCFLPVPPCFALSFFPLLLFYFYVAAAPPPPPLSREG